MTASSRSGGMEKTRCDLLCLNLSEMLCVVVSGEMWHSHDNEQAAGHTAPTEPVAATQAATSTQGFKEQVLDSCVVSFS